MRGGINPDSVHGGWLLPTVAGGYVASLASAEVGLRELAIAAFAVGTFFWVVMFLIVFVRMIIRTPLPGPLVPTLAILAAPPALAGRAWFDITGLVISDIQLGIAALGVLAILMQLGLVALYRPLKFTLGFWSFSFPLAALGRYGIAWLAVTRPVGWQLYIDIVLAIVTFVIVAIAALSIRLFLSDRRSGRAVAEQQLTAADRAATN
jgi:tellurite resistance protein